MTRKNTRKTRQSTVPTVPAASVAVPPAGPVPPAGAIAQILEDLDFVKGLLATAHAAAGTEDIDPEDLQTTLGYALDRLCAGMERVRAIRPTDL